MTIAPDNMAAQTRRTAGKRMAGQRVCATPEAVAAIVHLRAQLGNLVLRHVGGKDCSPEVRLVSSTSRGPDDVALGTVGGVLFLIDREHDLALGCPDFDVDVATPMARNNRDGVHGQHHLISRAGR